jgi:hypothetical protein
MYARLGDPVNSNVPDGDYSHIPINDEMVDLLADGIIASGAEVLADPDKMKIILRYEDWMYRATSGCERDPGLWY